VPEPKSWNYWKESPWKEKYAVGGNAMATVYQWAMTLGKGQDARKWTKQDLEEIKAYGLEKWKGSLTVAPSQGIQTDLLVRGDVTTTDDCDCASAIAAQKQGKDVKFALPEGPKKMWVNCYFIFAGSKNSDTAHAWLNNLISTEVAAQMANNLGEAVTNKDAYGKMPPDSAVLKKVGYNLPIMNDIIMKAEFNVLPDSSPKDQYVSLADIYKIFDEIKAKTGRK
jgi:spermidine/putrescine-binding protein